MKYLIKSISIIASVLLSAAYFLLVYQDLGFEFTVKCLAGWGLVLASYATIVCVGKLMYDGV